MIRTIVHLRSLLLTYRIINSNVGGEMLEQYLSIYLSIYLYFLSRFIKVNNSVILYLIQDIVNFRSQKHILLIPILLKSTPTMSTYSLVSFIIVDSQSCVPTE